MSVIAIIMAALMQAQPPPVFVAPPRSQHPHSPPANPEPLPQERAALPHLGRALATRGSDAIANFDLALARLPQPTRFRGLILCMQGDLLAEAGEGARAAAAIDECHRLLPDDPRAQMRRAMQYIDTNDFVRAAPLIAAALRVAPEMGAWLPVEHVGVVLTGLQYARRDDVREQFIRALVDAGFGKDDPEFYSGIARQAVLDRVRERDVPGAVALLSGITDPDDGLMMLIDRRYEAVWPQLEEWAHNDLTVQRDALLRQARARAAVEDTPEARLDLNLVLERTGHREEAKRRLVQTIADPALWDDFRLYAGMSAVRLSRMMVEDGVTGDTAIQPMIEVLGDAPITRDTGGLHTVTPNLARRYILQGRHDLALAVVDRHGPKPGDIYQHEDIGFMVAMRVCAFYGKGDTAGAARERSDLILRYATNVMANQMAAQCVGDVRDQGAALRLSVEQDRTRSSALLDIARARQRLAQGLPAVEDPIGGAVVDALYTDPVLIALVEHYGRALPASFLPALDHWKARKPLDAAARPR